MLCYMLVHGNVILDEVKFQKGRWGGRRMTCQVQVEVITTSAFTETYEHNSDKGPVKQCHFPAFKSSKFSSRSDNLMLYRGYNTRNGRLDQKKLSCWA